MTSETPWHKSTYSGARGDCVEVAEGPTTGVRDTQNRAQAQLSISGSEWTALLSTLRTN
ncbi:DUF397 domain-containing protein [Nocardiopsis alba]|uniref:DUF397 domain-containing protein n=1 Tax=Nocardiopsis alba (strain ATCC BAA-2165 / BE74) TaxID=1205910 RepID=J7L3C8_NOCAA|nr:DUF397 domain-containing protein [Nocardiopsis alba]AFR08138.1 hypothetical protein B005_4400 [Nocardiopsis alba ATCC BAA-2165]